MWKPYPLVIEFPSCMCVSHFTSPASREMAGINCSQIYHSWGSIFCHLSLSIFPFRSPRIWEARNECGKKQQWIRMTPNFHIKWEDFHVHRPIKGMASHNRKSCCFKRLAVSIIYWYLMDWSLLFLSALDSYSFLLDKKQKRKILSVANLPTIYSGKSC